MTLEAIVPTGPDFEVDWSDLCERFDWAARLTGCPQDPEWHAEGDVGIHTRMVLEWLSQSAEWRELDAGARAIVFWACLLHDVAKPATTRQDDEGRWRAKGHSSRGAKMARRILWEADVERSARELVCGLVAFHQVPFFALDRDDAERQLITTSWRARCDLLALVAEADARGRTCADQSRLTDNVELYREMSVELGCADAPYPFVDDHTRLRYFEDERRTRHDVAHPADGSRVIMMVGPPGAGKDHWIAQHAGHLPVVSLDSLRRKLGVVPGGKQGPVIQEAREHCRVHLRGREPFVFNATNIDKQRRRNWRSLFFDYGATLEIVEVEASPAQLHEQNRDREHDVPEAVLDAMLDRWEAADLTEAHALRVVEGELRGRPRGA